MPRSRNIKPGFFTNDDLAEIEPLGRLLFVGLWTIADKDGRLRDRPRKIRVEILPYDDVDAESLLLALEQKKFIVRYEIDGEKFIQIRNWDKHQNPHKKEAASQIPAQPVDLKEATESTGNSGTSPENTGASPADSLNLIPDSCIPSPSEKALDEQIWKTGVSLLGDKKSDRSLIGKWVSEHGKEKVAAVIAQAVIARPVEPKAYITALLQDRTRPTDPYYAEIRKVVASAEH